MFLDRFRRLYVEISFKNITIWKIFVVVAVDYCRTNCLENNFKMVILPVSLFTV